MGPRGGALRREPRSKYPYARAPFARFATWTARATGHPLAFVAAVLLIAVWLVTGPLFRFRDTWPLVLTTGTSSVTFLMVFRIQNPQNRDSAAVPRKPDALLRAVAGAHHARLDLEELAEGDVERLRGRYQAMARQARADLLRGLRDTDTADLAERPER